MKVRMVSPCSLEVHGIMRHLKPGDHVEVSRGMALTWQREGSCVILDRELAPSARPVMGNAERETSRPSEMIRAMRTWWYGNQGGHFEWKGRCFSRAMVHLHGGPDPTLNCCPICQADEWASRLGQRQTWTPDHSCAIADPVRTLISRQGSPDWPHFQVNYWYAAHAGEERDAPRCALVEPFKGQEFIWNRHCDQSVYVFLRQLAQICHYDVVSGGGKPDWSRYDFAIIINSGSDEEEGTPVPPNRFPTVMYGHDL